MKRVSLKLQGFTILRWFILLPSTCREWCLLTVSWCVLWCFALSDEFENAFGQPRCWQRYGFSPVWDRMWIFKFSSLEKALLHPGNWRRKVAKLVHWHFVLLIVNIFHPKQFLIIYSKCLLLPCWTFFYFAKLLLQVSFNIRIIFW